MNRRLADISHVRLSLSALEDRSVPAAGSVDVTFGTGGFSTAHFGVNDDGVAVAVGSDGKVVLVGNVNGQGQDFGIARFLPNGGLDTSFNGTGRLQSSISSSHDYARDVIVLDDGKILVAGGSNISRHYDFVLARYNANGSRDGSFGSNGVTTTNFDGSGRLSGSEDSAAVMLRRPDGRIVLVGSSNLEGLSGGSDAIALAQYSANGILDTNFGKVLTLASTVVPGGYQAEPTGAALDASGGIIVVGSVRTADGQPWNVFVVRYNADGTRDTAFGTVTFARSLTDNYNITDKVAIQTDGKIVVAYTAVSSSDPGAPRHVAIARLNANGTSDSSFGVDGVRVYTDQPMDRVSGLVIQSDGKLVIGGAEYVRRYEVDGIPDVNFGINGVQDALPGAYLDWIRDLAITPDGKLVLGGSSPILDAGRRITDYGVMRLEGDSPSAPLPPGITALAAGSSTVEAGLGTWLRVILNAQPTHNVVIGLSSTDTTEGAPSDPSVTFTPDNWNVPQLIGIDSVDDTIADGSQPFTIVLAPAVSADPAYSGMNAPDIAFTNLDNEATGSGKKKLTAAAPGDSAQPSRLTRADVQPVLREAIRRHIAAGADPSELAGVRVFVRDLPGATLGEVVGNRIILDPDAAGWGWFVDRTPRNDSEFTTPGDQGEQNRIDLLSVLMHEVGHVLGHEHSEGGWMTETLSAGVRSDLPVAFLAPADARGDWDTVHGKRMRR